MSFARCMKVAMDILFFGGLALIFWADWRIGLGYVLVESSQAAKSPRAHATIRKVSDEMDKEID